VWVAPTAARNEARQVTFSHQPIARYTWAKGSGHILFISDKDGDENWVIFSTAIDQPSAKQLSPHSGARSELLDLSPDQSDKVAIVSYGRNPEFPDIYLADIITGERQLVYRNEAFHLVFTDRQLRPAIAIKSESDGSCSLFEMRGTEFTKVLSIPFEDRETTYPVGFERNGDAYYLISSLNRDKAALVRRSRTSDQEEELARHQDADVVEVLWDPISYEALAVMGEYFRPTWTGLNQSTSASLDFIRSKGIGNFRPCSSTDSGDRWIICSVEWNSPEQYYLFDRQRLKLELLFDTRPGIRGQALSSVCQTNVRTRDGLSLTASVTRPPGRSGPSPAVLLVHGGPWWRDFYDFNHDHQWLASRGYAVISVNYRGSSGFGKAFLNAGDREWGGAMQRDLIDTVEWAAGEGIVEDGRIAIVGESYGGYAALAALAFTPARFTCGISVCGPSNLLSFLTSLPENWAFYRQRFKRRVGDWENDEDRSMLWQRSPLRTADNVSRPLLIAHGANDVRVNRRESDQLVAALQSHGTPVTYLLYPDEGHTLARSGNRMSFRAIAENFLSRHLGGEAEPIDIGESSVQAIAGIEHTPGLAAALGKTSPYNR
jgi:dienelactone hydrolase